MKSILYNIFILLATLASWIQAHEVNKTESNPFINRQKNIPVYNKEFTASTSCWIRATDPFIYSKILKLIASKVKLINYQLDFANYTTNPLLINNKWSYKANKWSRVSSAHGQTLLSLAFNYGILSFTTLSFGVETLSVQLEDSPHGCVGNLSEHEKIDSVMHLLLRDFRDDDDGADDKDSFTTGARHPNILYNGNVETLADDGSVCHDIIQNISGHARFTDRCCHIDRVTNKQICTADIKNIWLTIIYALLLCIKFSMLLFGPLLFIPMIETITKENIPYVVKLKEAMFKKILLVKPETPLEYSFDKVLDLRKTKGFPKFKKAADELPLGEPINIKISQYDILVDYKKLMIENKVPVGLMQCLGRTIFQCRLKEVGPFRDCCYRDAMTGCDSDHEVLWIDIWQKVAEALLVLLFPTPYYFRLLIYYLYEYPEMTERYSAIKSLGLTKSYEGSLLHYLTPIHPVFITMYVLYFITAITLAFSAKIDENGKFKKMIVGSFQDLKHLSWINALGMVVSNFLWPYSRFGLKGCLVALVYLPIAMPVSIVICLFYCLPPIYITFRMLFHSRKILVKSIFKKRLLNTDENQGKYGVQKEIDKSLSIFETAALFSQISPSNKLHQDGFREHIPRSVQIRRIFEHILVAILCILTMFSILILMSECVGFIAELMLFTMMGVIVNAGSVLKYTTLLALIFIYSYATFNNVERKYLKLNKSLISEVKSRIKDIDKITSLPSYLQENRGFKSQELSEQADYEQPDDVINEPLRQWLINDLVLFIDNEDMPRIPCQLFNDVCNIRVAGAPGPVYNSFLKATKTFLMIIGFLLSIFLVILSFGGMYGVSTTNQMLAILAGGFLPFVLKSFLQPNKPDIELGTVSFRSKLDEIIKNFYQQWPMYDFPFTVAPKKEFSNENKNKDEALNYLNESCACHERSCLCKRLRDGTTQTDEAREIPLLNVQAPTPSILHEPVNEITFPIYLSSDIDDTDNDSSDTKQKMHEEFKALDKQSLENIDKSKNDKSEYLAKDRDIPPDYDQLTSPLTFLATENSSNLPENSRRISLPNFPKRTEDTALRQIAAPNLLSPTRHPTSLMLRRQTSPSLSNKLENGNTTPRKEEKDLDQDENEIINKDKYTSKDTKPTTSARKGSTISHGVVENLPLLDKNEKIQNFLLNIGTPNFGSRDSVISAMDYKEMITALDDMGNEKVDLLVFLPEYQSIDYWLQEWSDIDQFDDVPNINGETESVV